MTKISLVVFEDSFGTAIFPTYDMFSFCQRVAQGKGQKRGL